jgi:hypothetical protein
VFRAALAGLLALGSTIGLALAPVAAAPAEVTDPLVVHIDTISPVLPRSGDVEISGTVTNVSDDTFTRINLHAFSSQTPILTASSLVDSAASDPTLSVGQRVTVPGTFDTVDELAPGESAPFSDSVPVELLGIPDEAGVYWIGIHALGDSSVPRDEFADGRARTFIPTRPEGKAVQEASVLIPVRSPVWYDAEGRIGGVERWSRRLGEGGSLDGVLDLAESAGAAPYTWLVDPAVLLAVTRLAAGNPPRSIAPDTSVPGQEPTPTETPTDGTSETPETLTPALPEGEAAPSDDEAALAATATAWLGRFRTLVGSSTVLALPFGDLDVSAAVRQDIERLTQALDRSAQVMTEMTLTAQLAIAPTDDVLSPEAIAATPDSTLILLGDNAFTFPPDSPSSLVRLLGHKVVVTSTGAESGGPGPTPATDPLALRQRLLSEAALRLLGGNTSPLVVSLPSAWRGDDAAAFFDDLEQPWLDVVPLPTVATRSASGVPARSLSYTDADVEAELDGANFSAATRAAETATVFEDALTLQTALEKQVADEVLVTLSEQHRDRPRLASSAAGRINDALRAEMAKVQIEAPTAVTLSSDSGPLGATLVNGLGQPVTVKVRATTDGDLTLTGDEVRKLGPRARSVVRFEATTSKPGVHNVRLAVTTVDGLPLGSSDQLPIRAAQVSTLIWILMAAGGLVLFGMIGYRLPGQIRARRRELAARERGDGTGPDDDDLEREGPQTGPGDADLVPERP